MIKFLRKLPKGVENQIKLENFMEPLSELLEQVNLECLHVPIEALTTIARVNEEAVAAMAPKITPKLLALFRSNHSEGSLGSQLIGLFKLWCRYEACCQIFVVTFIPFI
jgi:hypothetical protein